MIGTLLIFIVLASLDLTIPENFFKMLLSKLLSAFEIDWPIIE